MKLAKHDIKHSSKISYHSENPDKRKFPMPNTSLMANDAEEGFSDAMFEIHKRKQEEAREAEQEENRVIVELFPWYESVLPIE